MVKTLEGPLQRLALVKRAARAAGLLTAEVDDQIARLWALLSYRSAA